MRELWWRCELTDDGMMSTGVFDMPEERMLSHVKYDTKRRRLVVMTCRREDMVLPKSTFTMYGE
jgi:hypothetical protein